MHNRDLLLSLQNEGTDAQNLRFGRQQTVTLLCGMKIHFKVEKYHTFIPLHISRICQTLKAVCIKSHDSRGMIVQMWEDSTT